MYRFPWYLTLVSTNHASSNPGLVNNIFISAQCEFKENEAMMMMTTITMTMTMKMTMTVMMIMMMMMMMMMITMLYDASND